jgi:hypothetical protein
VDKKRIITKDDVGKMFRVYGYSGSVFFELIYEVSDSVYSYLCFVERKNEWCRGYDGVGPYSHYYFEEVNALTAIVLFGNNIPKEFKGFEHD